MGFRSFFSLLSKNFKLLYRSKGSTLFVLFFPLVILLLVGFAFNSSGISNVSVGYSLNQDSSISDSLFSSLEEKGFYFERFDSNDSCIDSLKLLKVQVCLVFPKDFSENGSSYDLDIYVDNSRINLAYSILNEINLHVSNASSSIGASLANEMIDNFESIKGSIEEEKLNIGKYKEEIKDLESSISNREEVPEIDEEIEDLKDIRSLLNDSSDLSKLNSGISLLGDFEDYSSDSEGLFYSVYKDLSNIRENLDDSISNLNKGILKINSLSSFDVEKITSPIKTKINSVNESSNNFNFLLPTIISLIGLFGGILLSSSFILKERKTKAYFRNFMTPTTGFSFLFADYITCLLVLIFQFSLAFVAFYFIFDIFIPLSNGILFAVLFLSLSVFILIGIFLGYLFKSEEAIIFSSVILASFMMFFSNVILPMESFFGNLKFVAQFNPFVVCDLALRKVMLFGQGYSQILNEIYILSGFFISLFILSFLLRKFTKKIL